MPQASDDLRDLMRMMFGDPVSESGPTGYLLDKGYTEANGLWSFPSKDHNCGEKEELCLRFLRDEWDYDWENTNG